MIFMERWYQIRCLLMKSLGLCCSFTTQKHVRYFNCPSQVRMRCSSIPSPSGQQDFSTVLVHQYSKMGGCGELMHGMAARIAEQGIMALTFDCRGVGSSTGCSTFTGSKEIQDVVAVCNWVHAEHGKSVVLLASSGGVVLRPVLLRQLFCSLWPFRVSLPGRPTRP